ncbi:MAG: bifunctional DNA-formamidopyrimidine glycosylase/DNA-(apurinic or apyrimidinic site) lyase, partial [Gammaproteobacteria bacterium]
MPELPEVETTLRGITPHILGKKIVKIIIRQPQLRWPIPLQLKKTLPDKNILNISRRGKYLLIHTNAGTLLLHLGMSGSLRVLTANSPAQKHDHVDLVLEHNLTLRYTDPRRFGCWLWTTKDPSLHPLIKDLGPEPLSENFDASYLYQASRQRRVPVKPFIMNSHIVVGVGNIYANESLFQSGINPRRLAGRISLKRYQQLTR